MADAMTADERSALMRRVRTTGTKPEIAVRSALHRLGYRFRVQRKDLPGTPDIVLPRWRTVIFVHGCFWHGCPDCDRGRRKPQTNEQLWRDKIAANHARDARAIEALTAAGWTVVTVWECQTTDATALPGLLVEALSAHGQ